MNNLMTRLNNESLSLFDDKWFEIAKKKHNLDRNPSLTLYSSMVYGFAKHLPYSMDIEQPEYVPADFLDTVPKDADFNNYFKYDDSRTFFRSMISFHETFESGIILQICFIFQKMILGEFPRYFELKDSDFVDWGIDKMTSNQKYNKKFFMILKTLPAYYQKVVNAPSNEERRKQLEEMYNRITFDIARLWGGPNNIEYTPEHPPATIAPHLDVVLKVANWGITYYDGIPEIVESIRNEQLKKYHQSPPEGIEEIKRIESSKMKV